MSIARRQAGSGTPADAVQQAALGQPVAQQLGAAQAVVVALDVIGIDEVLQEMQCHVRRGLAVAGLWPEDAWVHLISIHHQSTMVDR